jgi:hypothetical protein
MSVANVAAVDAALVAVLRGDATLQALVPDGVWLDVAPAGPPPSTRFVIVQHLAREDTEGLGTALYERFVYLVKAVVLTTTGVNADGAALRIHELLQDQSLAPIAGYDHMSTLRIERVRYPDVDSIDDDLRWQHAGGQYEIFVSPTQHAERI